MLQVEWVVPSLDLLLIDCLLENLKVLYDPATERCACCIECTDASSCMASCNAGMARPGR
jgi:hypothetical protein